MLDIDDVNALATQLRTKDPQAVVTRHHMNRLHGIQSVTKALELNHERFERRKMEDIPPAQHHTTPLIFRGVLTGSKKRRTLYG